MLRLRDCEIHFNRLIEWMNSMVIKIENDAMLFFYSIQDSRNAIGTREKHHCHWVRKIEDPKKAILMYQNILVASTSFIANAICIILE